MLHEETVDEGTLALIKKLSADEYLKDFILVGGTALSLQIGHRKSTDIDLFNRNDFDAKFVLARLSDAYHFEKIDMIKNGILGFIDGIKIDMIGDKHDWVNPAIEMDNIRMASLEDIAAMKLNAIVENGGRLQDFVDIYHLLNHRTLEEMTNGYEAKYPERNKKMATNALLYHDQIDFRAEIRLLDGVLKWPAVAEKIKRAVSEPKRSFGMENRNRLTMRRRR